MSEDFVVMLNKSLTCRTGVSSFLANFLMTYSKNGIFFIWR